MKASTIAVAAAIAMALAGAASAECVYPKTPPAAPNGSTATEAEMLDGKRAFQEYNNSVTAYLACLEDETNKGIAAAGDNADQVKQLKAIMAKRHNAAIDELQARADEFNQQIRAYKNKGKS